jgi:hypothetical protein
MTNQYLSNWTKQANAITNQHNSLHAAIEQHNKTNAEAFVALIALIKEAVCKSDYKLLADAFPAFQGLPESYQEKIAHAKSENGRLKDVISISANAFGARKGNWKNQERMLSILESLPNPFKPLTLAERKEKSEKAEKTEAQKAASKIKTLNSTLDWLVERGLLSSAKADLCRSDFSTAVDAIKALEAQNEIGAGSLPSQDVKSA